MKRNNKGQIVLEKKEEKFICGLMEYLIEKAEFHKFGYYEITVEPLTEEFEKIKELNRQMRTQ